MALSVEFIYLAARLALWMKERGMSCTYGIKVPAQANLVHTFSGSFGSAVDERTKNKLYGNTVSAEFIYLAARLARQWMKEQGISCTRGKC